MAHPQTPWTCNRCRGAENLRLARQFPDTSWVFEYPPPPGPDARCQVCGAPPPLEEQDRLRAKEQTRLLERIAAALERDWPPAGPASRAEPALTLSLEEAQGILGCGRTKIFELLRQGRLTGKRLGRERRILRESVERLLADAGESWRTGPPVGRRRGRARGGESGGEAPNDVARKIEDLEP